MPSRRSTSGSAPDRAPLSPLGALVRGIAAGAIASAAQDLFFRATAKVAPHTTERVLEPPEPEQREEQATETVARRVAELTQRDLPVDKESAARVVHYAFGSSWGGAYGLSAATYPALVGPLGGAAFGVLVWAASDSFLLPAFKLAAWPHRYPLRVHAYAIAAHLAYGAALGLAFDAMTPRRGRLRETLVRASDVPRTDTHPLRVHAPDMIEAGAGI